MARTLVAVDRHSLPTYEYTRRASWVSKYNVLLVLCFFNMAQHQHVPTHVATPSSSCCERFITAPAPGGLFCVCASTEPAGTGIGAVCVEGGGQTLPKKMLNHTHIHASPHTHTHTYRETQNKAPHARIRAAMKRLFFSWKIPRKKRLARFLRASRASLLVIGGNEARPQQYLQ